jgi:multiple sugar transport system substrate-binding protein
MTSGQGCRVVLAAVALVTGVAQAAPGAPAASSPSSPRTWSLAAAARPYRGVTIRASFLPRPGYEAAIALLPEFEKATGIHVEWESIYYEKMRAALVSDFTSASPRFDVVLIDLPWIGEFVSAGWVTPLEVFTRDPALADPDLDLGDFFPILWEALSMWDGKPYGLPFDNYSGLLFYNKCMLRSAGFTRPPETWAELKDIYGPALTRDGKFAYALQSHAGETQSCDSFMRFVWPFGGSLLTAEFRPNLASAGAVAGLRFRQDLMRYMPRDIVEWEHEDVVKALADGRVAMITEWSGWYKWLTDPASSRVGPCLGVALEPAGPAGRRPALGGFALGVSARAPVERRAAAWLLIQWLTSKQKAADYIRLGGVPGRRSAYRDPGLRRTHPHFEPLATSWEKYGNPVYRPRFEEWHAISRIISDEGTRMMRGQVAVEDGMRAIDAQLRYVLFESGYYKDKPRLQ